MPHLHPGQAAGIKTGPSLHTAGAARLPDLPKRAGCGAVAGMPRIRARVPHPVFQKPDDT